MAWDECQKYTHDECLEPVLFALYKYRQLVEGLPSGQEDSLVIELLRFSNPHPVKDLGNLHK